MKKASSLRMLAFFIACVVVVTTCFTVSISAIWDYDDEGTGMPSPDDPTEGLPYPPEFPDDPYAITEYSFKYDPSVLDAETQTALQYAKAGDVVLLKVAVKDIDLDAAPLGLSAFEGTVTYDVENLSLFMLCDEAYAEKWFENCLKLTVDPGMSPFVELSLNKYTHWTPSNPAPDWYPEEDAGYGLHWGLNLENPNGANGVVADDGFSIIVPLKINELAEEGNEFTFTLPYPRYEQLATEYTKNSEFKTLYARGGAYTITIKNHADISENIATDSVYSVVESGYELGDKTAGILNDKQIPLTEKSNYDIFNGNISGAFDFAAPVDVSSVTFTFNDTDAADLPTKVEVYGVDADGGYTLLGEQATGVAYDEGFTYSSGFQLETATTVNSANAYQYTVKGFDVASYSGLYFDAYAADGSSVAIGEVEINGDYTKYSVTVENGTIVNPTDTDAFLPGTQIEIKADDIEDKAFAGWVIGEGGAGQLADANAISTIFVVGTADTVITATYTDIFYNLTVNYGSGSGEYAKGTVVDIVADAPAYGMIFSHWEVVSGTAVITDTNSATTTVTMGSGDSEIVAVYEEAPRYQVYLDYGSIQDASDDGYLEGTVLTLVPPTANELPDGKMFIGWQTLCGSGTLDSANNTFTVGTGDAEIFAVLVDIHKPVEDNLAPDSNFRFELGTTNTDLFGLADNDGWYDGGYINDLLYPMLDNSKWLPVASANNKIKLIARLNGAYDITGANVTVAYVPGDMSKIPPVGVKLYGANKADGSDASLLAELNANQMQSTANFIPFDEGINLTSIASKYGMEVAPSMIDHYQYVIFEFDCMAMCTNYRFGEIEIFGTESQFEITVENGTMDPENDNNLYYEGDVITIVADEITDKVFVGWTLSDTEAGILADSSSATTTYTVGIGDNTITAVYRDALYALTVVNGSGSGDYAKNSQVAVVADISSDPEKVFDKWIVVSGDATIADPDSATTTVTTNGVATIEATYKDRVYLLTVENGTGTGDYAKGTVVDIVANEAPADMVFSHWIIVTGSGEFEDANSATTKFTTSNEATTLRAVYVDILYKLEIQGGEQTTDHNLNGLKVGTTVDIEATIPEHKDFVKWEIVSGAGSFANAESASTTFTTGSGDTVIRAVFADTKYTLTVENGTGSGEYIYDTDVEITPNVPEGYVFAGWEVVDGIAEIAEATVANTTVTVKGDATVKAVFVEKEYTVDIINGKVDDDDKADSYKSGTVITIIADTAPANKHFVAWVVVSGDAYVTDMYSAETTVTVGSSDTVIRAEYADDRFSVVVENGTATGINPDGNAVGDIINIVADAAPNGKVFDKWEIVSGDATIADVNSEETNMTVVASNVVIRATYKDDGKTSPTGDTGVAVFALLGFVALVGTAVVVKKKED